MSWSPHLYRNTEHVVTVGEGVESSGYTRLHEIPSILPYNKDIPFEAAFMSGEPDNEHAQDPQNQPRKAANYSDADNTNVLFTVASNILAPRLQLSPQISSSELSHFAVPIFPQTSSQGVPQLPKSPNKNDEEQQNPPSRSRDRSQDLQPEHDQSPASSAPPTTLGHGVKNPLKLSIRFTWDRDTLAHLCVWKDVRKKGTAKIAESGDFPGHTAQSLEAAWNAHKVEARKYYHESRE